MNKRLFIGQLYGMTLALIVFLAAAPAQDRPVEIRLNHDALGKAATIDVRVGAKTYPFLLDTGSGMTIITPDLAKEIGCTPFGRVSGLEAAGKKLDLARCDGVELKIGDRAVKTNAAVRSIMPFFSPETPTIGGVIALQTFENEALTIDLAGNRIWLETETSLAARTREMKALETRVSRPFAGAGLDVLAAANTPQGKIWLQFDTGNLNWSHIAPHALKQLDVSLDAPNKAKTVKPVGLELAGLGAFEFMAREREMIYDVRLNYDTLVRLVYTVDLKTGRMWAKIVEPAIK
jgi:predicted aspartyl protease